MPVNEFEKQVQQKMDELKFTPSAEVWTEVEKRIRKEKKRRRVIFWWLMPLLLVGGGVIYFTGNDKQAESVSQAATSNQQKENKKTSEETETADLSTTNKDNNRNNGLSSSSSIKNNESPTIEAPATSQYNTDPFTGINVDKAAVTKKKKTDPAKPNEESEIATTGADKEIKNIEQVESSNVVVDPVVSHKEEANETLLELKPDSTIVAKEEQKQEDISKEKPAEEKIASPGSKKEKTKWTFGFGVNGGASNTRWGNLIGGGQASYDATPLTSAPGTGSSYNGPPIYIEAPEKGLSASVEVFAQKVVSKRLDLRAALHYQYLSTHIKAGAKLDSLGFVYNSISNGVRFDNLYRGPTTGDQDDYTNRYHFAGLSATLSWKIVRGDKFSLSWENGLTVSRLLSTNALHYDKNLRAYYKDFGPFRKTQFFINSGLSIPVINKTSFSLSVNPFISYGLSRVLKDDTALPSHYVNYGVGLRFLFPSKK